MANGSFDFGTSNKYITGKIEWQSNSNGSNENTSNVNVSLYFKKSSQSTEATRGTWNGSITIDGTKTSISQSIILSCNDTYQKIGTASKLITHDSNGQKAITISATGGISGTSFNSGEGSGVAVLDTIPRASSIKCESGNIGEKTNISIDRKADNFKHILKYEFGNLSGIITKDVEKSYVWTIPTSFYSQIPNSNTGKGTITCETYNDNTLIGTTTCEFSAKVINSNPQIGKVYYEDTNDDVVKITGNNQRIVRKLSSLLVTVEKVTAKNSATITECSVTFNNVTVKNKGAGTFGFRSINLSSNAKAVIKATDSRGNVTTTRKDIIIDDWEMPSASIDLHRLENYYAETHLKVNTKYSSVNGKNNIQIYYMKKKRSDSDYYKNIEIGDNLNSKALKIDFPDNMQFDSQFKDIIKAGTNTISTGNRTEQSMLSAFVAVYCGEEINKILYKIRNNIVEPNLKSYTLPSNFGTVTEIDKTQTPYQYIKLPITQTELQNNKETITQCEIASDYDFRIVIKDKFATVTYNVTLARGIPIVFFDRRKRSTGFNCFPKNEETVEIDGIDIGTIKQITKELKLTADTWQDTGISGADLEAGTYILQLQINAGENTGLWNEFASGLLTWYANRTNSTNYDADEIPLSKAGHSRNKHIIKLRTLRTPNSGSLKLQICDSISWNGSANVVFRLRRMI